MSEAEVDKTLEESFPASDPPSWTLGTDHGRSVEPADDEERENRDAPGSGAR
jgi:hypothetical protein